MRRYPGGRQLCTITVTFTPTAVGLQYGKVKIFDTPAEARRLSPHKAGVQSRRSRDVSYSTPLAGVRLQSHSLLGGVGVSGDVDEDDTGSRKARSRVPASVLVPNS